jgi:putative ABC transport system permease protein
MIALLTAVSVPYLRNHTLRIFLTLLGVIIGVQGMVAMAALNRSIIDSFAAGVEAIAGDAKLQIAGPETGIPESLIAEAQAVTGVVSATGLIEGTFRTTDGAGDPIGVFGVDLVEQVGKRNPQFPREHVHIPDELRFLNATDSIALSQPLLDRLRLAIGSSVRLVTSAGLRTFTVRGSLDPIGPAKLFAGSIALLDMPAAQELLLSPGLVQTIYVAVQPSQSSDAVAERLRAVVGSRARVEPTAVRGQQIDSILATLRAALSLASLVTMIVAFFIIYQTIAISVDQRRRDIAIARALGFTRGTVVGVYLIESALLGVIGAAGGVAGGYLLARLSLHTVVAGISDMYLRVAPSNVTLPVVETMAAAALGMVTCLLAGALPALQAAREPPAQILRSTAGARVDALHLFPALTGVLSLVIARLVLGTDLRIATSGCQTAWVMLGHTLIIVGFALLASLFVWVSARLLMPISLRTPLPVSLAIEFFSRQPKRVAATVSAIMVGYALVVVLGSVVHSMDRTLGNWITHIFAADLTVGMPAGLASGTFDSSLVARLEQIPGVASVERHRTTLLTQDGHPVILSTFDRRNRPDRTPLLLISATPEAYMLAERGRAVFVSESFAFRYGYHLGDQLDLDTASGRRRFAVAAIVRDYTYDLGTILVDIDTYQTMWRDKQLTYAHLWQSRKADIQDVRSRIAEVLGSNPRVNVVTNVEYRAEVQERVRNLLRVLGSLQVFACTIAMLGVAIFLLAATLDRKREMGLLRSIGVTRRQIRYAVVLEAGLIGLSGATMGVIAGFPAAFYMVTHSTRIYTGLFFDFSFPVALAASTLVAITLAAAAAGYIPARRITAGSVLAGLQTE